jgi:hypothetical protein
MTRRSVEAHMDYVIRFFAGSLIVSLLAIMGDVVRPKRFAGLFGAAPSVALVTLTLAFRKHGGLYVSTEGRSMISARSRWRFIPFLSASF